MKVFFMYGKCRKHERHLDRVMKARGCGGIVDDDDLEGQRYHEMHWLGNEQSVRTNNG